MTLAQVLAYPKTQTLDDATVGHSVAQRFDILALDNEKERNEYIRAVLSSAKLSPLAMQTGDSGRDE